MLCGSTSGASLSPKLNIVLGFFYKVDYSRMSIKFEDISLLIPVVCIVLILLSPCFICLGIVPKLLLFGELLQRDFNLDWEAWIAANILQKD